MVTLVTRMTRVRGIRWMSLWLYGIRWLEWLGYLWWLGWQGWQLSRITRLTGMTRTRLILCQTPQSQNKVSHTSLEGQEKAFDTWNAWNHKCDTAILSCHFWCRPFNPTNVLISNLWWARKFPKHSQIQGVLWNGQKCNEIIQKKSKMPSRKDE